MMGALAADEDTVPPYPVQNALTGPLRRAAAAQGRASYLSLWAGQGVPAARALPAAELVRTLESEWHAARQKLAAGL
jgi:nitronate monooxygenase